MKSTFFVGRRIILSVVSKLAKNRIFEHGIVKSATHADRLFIDADHYREKNRPQSVLFPLQKGNLAWRAQPGHTVKS